MKVAIITMHAARNYGAVLQTYALQYYLEKMGNEVEIIDYRLPNQSTKGYLFNVNSKFKKNPITKLAYLAKTLYPKYITTRLFRDFQKRRLKLSCPVTLDEKKRWKFPSADIYCSGSDQIWNPRANGGFNSAYFFDGVTGKKISYASSIGINDLTDEEEQIIKENLRDYSSISIRELSSIPILKKLGYQAVCVIDPTLLLKKEEWECFSDGELEEEPYLLVYYFGNAKSILSTANQIAHKRGLRVRRISVGFEKYTDDDVIEKFITPERFVLLFLNASYVVTNSFHGTIFSINFEKQFLSYPTTDNNARFDSVFQMFDLQGRNLRKYSGEEYINLPDIDYVRVSRVLAERREESYIYLKHALQDEV